MEPTDTLAQCLPADALGFCVSAYEVCQVWDDLVDDGRAAPEAVNKAFQDAILEWNRNPFFNQHHQGLVALLGSIVLQWHTANAIEAAKDKALLPMAYTLRAGVLHLFVYCVYLVHGMDTARLLAPKLYALYGETFEGYLKEMTDA